MQYWHQLDASSIKALSMFKWEDLLADCLSMEAAISDSSTQLITFFPLMHLNKIKCPSNKSVKMPFIKLETTVSLVNNNRPLVLMGFCKIPKLEFIRELIIIY